jgi:acyl carrier protein
MSRDEQRRQIVAFLRTIQRPGAAVDAVADEENLFDAGVVDSLAMLQIILLLERQYGIELSRGGFDPTELHSIGAILGLIERRAAT